MKSIAVVLGVLGLAFVAGCSDPCGDLKDCCVAQIDAMDWTGMEEAKVAAQAVCDGYDDADSDACQAVIDAYTPPEGIDVPEECEF